MSRPVVSVLIPSRNERFLHPTIIDVLEKAVEPIEVIAVLDGYWTPEIDGQRVPPDDYIVADPRVRYLHRGQSHGMRAGINAAAALARGDFLLKADGHCMFSEGFDRELAEGMGGDDWVAVPRRKRLDAENWCLTEENKPDIDYMFLSFPDDPNDFGGKGLNGKVWEERNRDPDLKKVEIDDLMSAQGSAWFMPRPYFEWLELMDEASYGPFWNEAQEIMQKVWLSGGRCVVNKRCWYAHLHKGRKYGRGYRLQESWLRWGAEFTWKWIANEAWAKQTLPFSSIIEKFWPVPTWPDDWREQLWGEKGEPWSK